MSLKRMTMMAAALVAVFGLGLSAQQPPAGAAPGGPGRGRGPTGPGLTLTTTAFADGAEIPVKYTSADPNGVSPKLDWTNVPAGTVTFALIFHDPDVALQRNTDDVLHWMVFNIPGTATGLPEAMSPTATMPDGTIQAKNIRGAAGYMGPGAPAPGPHHHYTFELFALDTKLDLTPDATRADVLKAMHGTHPREGCARRPVPPLSCFELRGGGPRLILHCPGGLLCRSSSLFARSWLPAALGAGLLLFAPPVLLSAQNDLDAFMQQVVARRDDNWKKLQQYILDEREVAELRGPGNTRMWGEDREYTWFIRDGYFIRSPVKFDGVTIGEDERRKAEEQYLQLAQRRDARAAAREASATGEPKPARRRRGRHPVQRRRSHSPDAPAAVRLVGLLPAVQVRRGPVRARRPRAVRGPRRPARRVLPHEAVRGRQAGERQPGRDAAAATRTANRSARRRNCGAS